MTTTTAPNKRMDRTSRTSQFMKESLTLITKPTSSHLLAFDRLLSIHHVRPYKIQPAVSRSELNQIWSADPNASRIAPDRRRPEPTMTTIQ
jgi:hypothetical protein